LSFHSGIPVCVTYLPLHSPFTPPSLPLHSVLPFLADISLAPRFTGDGTALSQASRLYFLALIFNFTRVFCSSKYSMSLRSYLI
jgi:hypothetical protein